MPQLHQLIFLAGQWINQNKLVAVTIIAKNHVLQHTRISN